MAYKGPERRKQLDEAYGLAELSIRRKIPVDDLLLLRATDIGREEQLRAATKEMLLAMAGFTAEKAKEELTSVETKGARTLLSPKQVEIWLGGFKARFDVTLYLHEGVQFADVEKALRADPDAMRAFAELDKNGHETNVFGEDDKTFEIGTCSLEAASGHRNIVFDKAAQDLLNKDDTWSGNAVDVAKEIGVDLMDEDQVKSLRRKLYSRFLELNSNSWDWLKTDPDTRERRRALFIYVNGIREDNMSDHSADGAFRAVRKVNKVA